MANPAPLSVSMAMARSAVVAGRQESTKYAARYAKAEKSSHKMKHRHQKHGRAGH